MTGVDAALVAAAWKSCNTCDVYVGFGIWVFGLGILGLLILVLWIVGLVDIFRRSDLDRQHKAGWILVVVLLPLIGTVTYFAMRPMTSEEQEQAVAAELRRRP